MITLKNTFKPIATITLLLVLFVFFGTTISAQENGDTLGITILNNNRYIIDKKELLFTDIEKELKQKSVPDKNQWAILKSANTTIVFQNIVDLLTVINKYNFKIKSECPIIISDIDYYHGRLFDSNSLVPLDGIIEFLNENKNLNIEIGVHANYRGTYQLNAKLNTRRAEKVIEYLISKGIDKRRLTAKGYGEDLPLIKDTKTENEHSTNRQTELKIIY